MAPVPWRRVVDGWLLAMLVFILAAGDGHMGHDYYQLPLVPICALYFAAAAWPAFDAGWIRADGRARTRAGGRRGRGHRRGGRPGFLHSGVIERHFRPANLDVRALAAGQAIDASRRRQRAHGRRGRLRRELADAAVLRARAGLEPRRRHGDGARRVGVRLSKGARYFATTRWAEVQRKQPDLAMFLESRRGLALNNAPQDTVLFDLTQSR